MECLGATGQIHITHVAASRYAEHVGVVDEEARRGVPEVLMGRLP